MKYIDADKIKAEIKRRMSEEVALFDEQCQGGREPSPSSAVVHMRYQQLLKFIDQMQQEDPLPPGIENESRKKEVRPGRRKGNHQQGGPAAMRLLLRWIFYIACVTAAYILLDIGFGQYWQASRLVGFISRNAGVCLLLITGAYLHRKIIDRGMEE